MSSVYDKTSKPQLVAIYRLEFYKSKKQWKLSNEKKNDSTPPYGCVKKMLKPDSDENLNKTYNVKTDSSAEREKNPPLNHAFMHEIPFDEEPREANDTGPTPPTPQPWEEAWQKAEKPKLWMDDEEDTDSLRVLQNSQESDFWTNPLTEQGQPLTHNLSNEDQTSLQWLLRSSNTEAWPHCDLLQDKTNSDWDNQSKPVTQEQAQDEWPNYQMANDWSEKAAHLAARLRKGTCYIPSPSSLLFKEKDWYMPADGAPYKMYEEIAGQCTPEDHLTLKAQSSIEEMQTPSQIRKNTEKWLRRLLAVYRDSNEDNEQDEQAHDEGTNFIREAHEVPHSSECDPNESCECVCSFECPDALPALSSQLLSTAVLHAAKSLQALLKEQLIRDQLRDRTLKNLQECPIRDVGVLPEVKDGSHLRHTTTEFEEENEWTHQDCYGQAS